MGWIYSIRCKITGKLYIGQTKNEVAKRWRQHQCPSNLKDTHLSRAIKLYGWSQFEFKIVTECPQDELDKWEIHYIAKWDTFNNGLNSTPGGQAFSPMLVPEVKQKRIDVMKIPDVRERWLVAITAAQRKPEQRALLSKLCTERCKDPDHMKKRAEGIKRFLETLNDEEKEWVTARMRTPEATAKRVKALKATLATPIGKKNHSDATKRAWADPTSRSKRMEALKKAAEKRKKPKPPKIPYDRQRRAEAMRLGWLKRKGIVQRTISAFEEGADAEQAAGLHSANEKKRVSQSSTKNVAKKAKRVREKWDDDLCEHMGANARVSSVCRKKAKSKKSFTSHLKSTQGRNTLLPVLAELFEEY